MVNILSPSGLEDPIGGEAHSRAMLSRNWVRINDQLPQIDTVASTIDVTNFNFTSSVFTRIRVGVKGIVVAAIRAVVDTADALPLNTAAGDSYSDVIPAGYRPKVTQNYFQSIVTGAGRGDEVQTSVNPAGAWLIRGNTGSVYTTIVGSQVNSYIVYEWDGVL